MIELENLKAIGMVEKRLALKAVEKQKLLLQKFRTDPEVAKALTYLERFNESIPETHPIFDYIERLRERLDGKEIVKEVIQSKVEKKTEKKPETEKTSVGKNLEEIEKEEEERKLKKMEQSRSALNDLLSQLEVQNDNVFKYLNENIKSFSAEYGKMSQILKLRRFLISVKSGIKNMRIK